MGKIDTSEWKEFRIGDLFETQKKGNKLQVPTGASVPVQDLLENGSIPRITVTGSNNGIFGFYDYCGKNNADYRVFNNFVSVSFLGTVFYQEGNAILDMKVHCLKPNEITLNKYTGQFLVGAIRASLRESTYSDQISSSILPEMSIKLPSTPNGDPDWDYMESYMANLETKVADSLTLLQAAKDAEKKKVDTREWGEFHLYDIFCISMGNKFDRSKMCEVDEGINFVGRSAMTNGVACAVTPVEDKKGNTVQPYPAGDITVALGGSIGAAFVQDREFYTSQNVCVLHTDDSSITERAKWFVAASITASCGNYEAFTDELNRHIRTDFIIRLPVDKTGQPDWAYMEEYMRRVEETAKNVLNCFEKDENDV